MTAPTSDQVLGVLALIQDPDLGRDVVSLGMIKELEVSPEGKVSFTFELTTPACPVRDRFKSQAQDLVGDLPGVTGVEVRMTAQRPPRIHASQAIGDPAWRQAGQSPSPQARAASGNRRWR